MRRALFVSAMVFGLAPSLAWGAAAKEAAKADPGRSVIYGPKGSASGKAGMGGLGTRKPGAKNQKHEDIRKLLHVTGSAQIGIQIMEQLVVSLRGLVPQAPEAFWTRMMEAVDPNEFVELIVPIYDKHLTHDDIRAMLAFYETPTGKKVIQVLPVVTQESMEVGQAWGARIGEQIVRELQEAQ